MFPKKGNKCRAEQENFSIVIAEALRQELGGTHRAAKTLMKWTGSSEKSAKNWLSGANAPSGNNLVSILRESEIVLRAILALAGRECHVIAFDVEAARTALSKALCVVEELIRERRIFGE